jgi:transcriptional regulator with XRE-family HTH domain
MIEIMKDNLLKKFGEHIKNLRVKSGLTQDDIVLNSNSITKATISDIENGKRNLSFTTLIDLAKGMNKHPKELLDFVYEKKEI